VTTSERHGPLTTDSLDARDRLLAALDGQLRAGCARELHDVTIEALADGATVSRATAYRYLGNKSRLKAHAAQLLVARYAPEAVRVAAAPATATGKIAAAMTFWAIRVSEVDLVRDALVLSPGGAIDRQLRQALAALFAPILHAGQADGQLRAEVAAPELLNWLIEQQLVLIGQGLTESETARWIERLVLPAVRARSVEAAPQSKIEACLRVVQAELDVLEALASRAQAIAAEV
jgi:AcrR family transcriptional regulator